MIYDTYSAPIRNTPIRSIFRPVGRCSEMILKPRTQWRVPSWKHIWKLTTGIGISRVTSSVIMSVPRYTHIAGITSIHLSKYSCEVPNIALKCFPHWSRDIRTNAVVHSMMNTIQTVRKRRYFILARKCHRRKQTDSFIRPNEITPRIRTHSWIWFNLSHIPHEPPIMGTQTSLVLTRGPGIEGVWPGSRFNG